VTDDNAKHYYFGSAVFPAVSWVDLAKVNLKPGASPMMLAVDPDKPLAGEVSAPFKKAKPFAWLR
jgi:penicillin V acylase-like amidase (Ntn superfamily)